MHEIGVDELRATSDIPFVRHHLDPRSVQRAWARGGARVVDGTVSRWVDAPPGPVRTCLGPIDELARLCADVDAAYGPPWRITVDRASYDVLPVAWRGGETNTWDWMATRLQPVDEAGPIVVQDVPDEVVTGVLDRANPDSFARPGTAGVECWLGAAPGMGEPIAAVGALVRQADGTGHLRGVSTLPEQRGRGLGRALSVELTRRALAGPNGLATLGVYTDNLAALMIYRALGYAPVHTFVSGLCGVNTLSSSQRRTSVAP